MKTKNLFSATCGLAMSALAGIAVAASPGESLAFKACPIVRDTDTVPCWLSEYEGQLYYLGIQTDIQSDFHPPYLGHQAIVEGKVTDKRICGGIVLEQVRVSPVAELDGSCNTILPAEEQYKIDFNPRPPGPSIGRYTLRPARARREEPKPPYAAREFVVEYYFDGRVEGRNARDLNQIMNYATQIGASRITVVGHQGGVKLSNGTVLQEREGLAQARAEEVARLLKSAGLTVAKWSVSWEKPAVPDGTEDWQARRTVVRVEP
jgi:hypothetical protein